jgi:hypothetical protein
MAALAQIAGSDLRQLTCGCAQTWNCNAHECRM